MPSAGQEVAERKARLAGLQLELSAQVAQLDAEVAAGGLGGGGSCWTHLCFVKDGQTVLAALSVAICLHE